MAKSSSKKNAPPKPAAEQTKRQDIKAGSAAESSNGFFDESLNDLFVCGLQKMYWTELHLAGAIPKMISAAKAPALKKALKAHLEVTKAHAERLLSVFEMTNGKVIAQKCDATEGLTIAGEKSIARSLPDSPIRDTAIIMSALKVENFEITSYKGLIDLAAKLDMQDAIDVFTENLDEESEASDVLQSLADSDKN